MNDARNLVELAVALLVGVTFVRYWRQIVAALVAVMVVLCVIGLMTVISWVDAVPRR